MLRLVHLYNESLIQQHYSKYDKNKNVGYK